MKSSTKELHVQTRINRGHTTMPLKLRQYTAAAIQYERPWSDLSTDTIVEETYNATANGCIDVYVHCDDKLVGWAHIGGMFDIHVGNCVSIYAMYVEPEYRDCGVAKKIIGVLKRAAREAGFRWCVYTHWAKPKTLVWKYIDLGE